VATSKLLLSTGEPLEVDGSIDDVTKALENATRSSAGTLARLNLRSAAGEIAVNPAHVVTVTSADD
jgi:hypothetical protein